MGVNALFHFLNTGNQRIFTRLKKWLQAWRIKKTKKLDNDQFCWKLGVDSPFYFSSEFAIEHSSITIIGSQITHNPSWPVKYSIVKKKIFGTSLQFFDSAVYYGDLSEGELYHTFHLPKGTGYQLMVFNYFKYHTSGEIKITQ
ncbi:hypothetical protein HPT25_17775 [Bacillus sp. BRMEA1]|uniref:hypothetical protein n=1 Tax=Neobacillus endophyticus TaxID=2738405 RepID=UPI001564E9FB|nr:hypothetical protein [Neobacillus endophyticus]NRD79211.1 hypothetical protein [Neobacillus endophyticus]